MTASGNDDIAHKRKKCKFRRTKIEQVSKTSNGGRFYDHCGLFNRPCNEKCVRYSGGE